MNTDKLNTIKETAEYYKLILRILKTNPSEKCSLTDKDKKLLLDDKLYNQFQTDSIAISVLIATQNKLNQKPNKKAFEKIFALEYTESNDIGEQLKQIRNCFAHALTNMSEDTIYFDNGKIKGSIRLDQLIFLPVLYHTNVTQKVAILAGGIVQDKIKNDDDLQAIIKKGKYTKFGTKSKDENFNEIKRIFGASMRMVDYKNMSPSQLTKYLNKILPNYNNFSIKSLSEYGELVQSYVDYIGKENFYESEFRLQQEIISDIVNSEENNRESHVEKLQSISNFLPYLLREAAEKDQKELDFSDLRSNGNILSLLVNQYKFPFLYEDTMYAYIYNRLIYLKELLNTNQIDESVLDYEEVDISDLQPQYFYSKKEISQRKSEICSKIDNLEKSIEGLEKQKDNLEMKLEKSKNPKNPNKDRDEKVYKEKIENKQRTIQEYRKNEEDLREEFEYIKTNNKIPVTSSMVFRLLRNSSAHSFDINMFSKIKAYKAHDLGQLIFEFNDIENGKKKSSLRITATRLEELFNDLEQCIMRNMGLVYEENNVLESAIEATEENVTNTQIYESGRKVIAIQEKSNIKGINIEESEL